jgi:hypothetical protein
MNRTLLDIWTTALRSGEYDQTRGALWDGAGYCCLGVLADLVADEVVGGWGNRVDEGYEFDVHDDDGHTYDCSATIPPVPVLAYCGLEERDANTLAKMNDAGLSFVSIANALEESWDDADGSFDLETEKAIDDANEMPEEDVA